MELNNKKILLKQLGILALINVVVALLLLKVLPLVYGELLGNSIGLLFGKFLANHEKVFHILEHCLRGGYVLLAVGGFDFLFLMMSYRLFNFFLQRNITWKEVAVYSARALKGLLIVQLVLGVVFLFIFGSKADITAYTLIPPFLTNSWSSSFYMMVWELLLLSSALGYVLTEDNLKAWLAGPVLLGSYFWLFALAAAASIALTWLPALFFGLLHPPTWLLIVLGVAFHTTLLAGCLFILFTKTDMPKMLEESKAQTPVSRVIVPKHHSQDNDDTPSA